MNVETQGSRTLSLEKMTSTEVTVEDFQSLMSRQTRIKFAAKILATLTFVEKHQNTAGTVGVSWCKDGRHFICNAKILGNFLALKSNSINTNFREHGFRICEYNQESLKSSGLPDFQHWKKRIYSAGAEFHRDMTLEAAERIGLIKGGDNVAVQDPRENEQNVVVPWKVPLVTQPYRTEKPTIFGSRAVNEKGIPDSLMMILEHDKVMQLSVQMIMEKADGTSVWKNQMIVTVTRDWITSFGAVDSIPLSLMLDNLLTSMVVLPPETYMQLRANVEYLINAGMEVASQGRGDVIRFDDYLLLMLRYGPSYRFARTIFELAAHDMADPFLDLNFGRTSCWSQSQGVPPNFKSWFHPGLNTRTAEMVLKTQMRTSWMVRPSSIPNMFTLHCKMLGKLIASHIRYDGLADSDQLYSIKLDDDQVKYAETWNQLLFSELELRPEDCAFNQVEPARIQTQIVDAQDVIAGNRESLILALEPMADLA